MLGLLAVFAAGTGVLAGCGQAGTAGSGSDPTQAPQAAARARQVAAAWDGSKAAEAWRAGYHPMGDAVQLPEGGLRGEDEHAYLTQNLVLDGRLPAAPDEEGRVTWASGGSLTRPLMDARKAYETFGRTGGGSRDEPRLTVTGARLGEMTLATTRGPATVPAWLFTLDGYDTPLKRVAVSPSKLPASPIRSAEESSGDGPASLQGLVELSEDGRSATVIGLHGGCDDGPFVHVLETDGSVVLSASVVGRRDGPCTAQLEGSEVTVKLAGPVGDRVLLDAATGFPVPYAGTVGSSPSWS
ncbi:hypothetical protein [Streptomyces cadmiisoli]|uniref:hypothetical protein n=1 Tax=Streptomyces cadmiisoli TaxID=2184053 RepID=UPI003662190F